MRDRNRLDERATASFEVLARRGEVRGADEVLRSASMDVPDVYPTVSTTGRRPMGVVMSVGAAVLVIIALLGGIWLTRGPSSDSEVAASPPATVGAAEPTPEELEQANEQLEADIAAGWVPFEPTPWRDDVEVPDRAWVRISDDIVAPGFDPIEQRIPVYDAVDGVVIGYDYLDLGYVPKELADSAAFDSVQARIEKHGCDVRLDAACRSAYHDQQQAELDRLVEEDRRAAEEG